MHWRRREGLETVSPRRLGQDELVECQIGDRPPEPLVLLLKLLQPLQLAPAHADILPAPAIVALLRDPDLAHRIGDRHALAMQHLDLPELQHDVFRPLSLSNHPVVLLLTR